MNDLCEGDYVKVPRVRGTIAEEIRRGRLLYINKKYGLVHLVDEQGGVRNCPSC